MSNSQHSLLPGSLLQRDDDHHRLALVEIRGKVVVKRRISLHHLRGVVDEAGGA